MGDGFFLGLATGSYCAAACLPVAVPFLFAEPLAGPAQNARLVVLFLLGRLAAYVAFGFGVGLIGGFAARSAEASLPVWLPASVNALLGLAMLLSGTFRQFPAWKACGWFHGVYGPRRSALFYGFLTGLNVCPPFVTAAARVFGQGGAWQGAAYFLLFFAGTSLYFLPLLGVSFLQKREIMLQGIGRWAMILVGAYFFLVQGLLRLAGFAGAAG
jgi:sulfite exporter TauE/SafE